MTETDSMVVRVAKAIADNETGSEMNHPGFMNTAHVAIKAMLEPTPAVLEEGYDKLDFYDEQSDAADQYNREVVQSVWSAMIRKALEE